MTQRVILVGEMAHTVTITGADNTDPRMDTTDGFTHRQLPVIIISEERDPFAEEVDSLCRELRAYNDKRAPPSNMKEFYRQEKDRFNKRRKK